MNIPEDFETIFETSFDIDEEASLELSDEDIIVDKEIRFLLREYRLALAKGKLSEIQGTNPALAYYDVPLICVVHADNKCRIRWSRLLVDLSPTKGALICDMFPREVQGDKPIELKTRIGIGLKFETVAKALSAEVSPEYTTSRTVYSPRIVSSGSGFTKGYWDFLSLAANDYLHVNRELRLLVSAPSGVAVRVRFNLRAEVTFDGVAGMLPLLTRSSEINEIYSLT